MFSEGFCSLRVLCTFFILSFRLMKVTSCGESCFLHVAVGEASSLTRVNVFPEDPELGVILKPDQTTLFDDVYLRNRAGFNTHSAR